MDWRATAYVSWGLWVADCPRPDCLGAEHFGHAPITGTVGGLTGVGFRCSRCGLVCASEWPANAVDIEWMLAQRPEPATRNWHPLETLDDLLAENIEHGLIPAGVTEEKPLNIIDNHIFDRPALPGTSTARRAIGGM
jgi:hypothetical protein